MAKNYMRVSTWFEAETEKAFALKYFNGRQGSGATEIVWFPKSQCIISHPETYADPDRKQIDVPVWLALKRARTLNDLGRFDGYMGTMMI